MKRCPQNLWSSMFCKSWKQSGTFHIYGTGKQGCGRTTVIVKAYSFRPLSTNISKVRSLMLLPLGSRSAHKMKSKTGSNPSSSTFTLFHVCSWSPNCCVICHVVMRGEHLHFSSERNIKFIAWLMIRYHINWGNFIYSWRLAVSVLNCFPYWSNNNHHWLAQDY